MTEIELIKLLLYVSGGVIAGTLLGSAIGILLSVILEKLYDLLFPDPFRRRSTTKAICFPGQQWVKPSNSDIVLGAVILLGPNEVRSNPKYQRIVSLAVEESKK